MLEMMDFVLTMMDLGLKTTNLPRRCARRSIREPSRRHLYDKMIETRVCVSIENDDSSAEQVVFCVGVGKARPGQRRVRG